MTRFEKIILEDCFAYSYLEFDFTSGIHSINGVNGASKTSVYLALAQGLFNKNPKGVRIDDVSNTITGRPYQITIYFSKDADKYCVINSRKTSTIRVERNGKDISRKGITQNLELIKEILNDSYDTFVSTTYQSSDSTLDLLEESGDTARKNFINRILKFDELDDLLEVTKRKVKSLNTQHKNFASLIDQLNSTLLPLREEICVIPTEELEKEVELLGKASGAAAWYQQEMAVKKTEVEFKVKAYVGYKEKLGKITELKEKLASIPVPRVEESVVENELKKLSEKIITTRAVISANRIGLELLIEPELVCSKCGQSVNSDLAIELYEKEKLSIEQDILRDKDELKELLKAEQSAQELQSIFNTISTHKNSISILESNLEAAVDPVDGTDLEHANDNYVQASNDLMEAQAAYSEAFKKLSEIKRANDLSAMVKKFNSEAEETNSKILARIKELTEESKVIRKRLDRLEQWQRILGPSGYRVSSMKKFLDVLNQTMDKYSGIISEGKVKCNFFVTSEGKIDFSVVDPDKQLPFANWSKGEQARVKLACLFSVIDLLEVKGSASYNVLVLDEIFSALDEEGKEGLFKVLANLRSNGKCIYTISHTPLVNPVVFDSTLKVVKESGLARIE